MNSRTLIALWKANMPPLAWGCSPLWIGAIIFSLDGSVPEWKAIGLFAVSVLLIQAISEFANSYTDRDEDKVYFPSNPFVTGELDAKTAKKAFVIENVIAATLLIALLTVTLNYTLIITMIVGWFAGVAYSLPPFKAKGTIAGPFFIALGCALLPISGWLLVAPLNDFIIAFAVFFFIHSLGYGITHKSRKTFHALSQGLIQPEQSANTYNLKTVDLGLKIRTALALEAVTTLGAFILIPIFWHLEIFDKTLSIGLLTLPLVFTALSIAIRIKDPIKNGQKGVAFMTMGWALIILIFFAVALTSLIHWSFVILACVAFLAGFALLLRTVYPFGREAVTAPWQEL